MFCYFNKKSGATEFYPSFMLLIGDALDSRNRTLAVMACGNGTNQTWLLKMEHTNAEIGLK